MRVEHDAPGFSLEAGQPHGQRGIVGERRFDADHDRLVRRPHDLHPEIGDLPGDAQARIVRAARGEAVRRLGEFQRHARPPLGDPQNMAAMVAPRLIGPRPDVDPQFPPRAAARGPCPATLGFGSSIAETTRAIPAAMTASAQGGEAPVCEQGSSVT